VDDGKRVSNAQSGLLDPLDVNRRIAQRNIRDLQYYNGDMHRASFALPNFVRDLVGTA
jgi:spermidine synthase